MAILTFLAQWESDSAAGIRAGSESVTITFRSTDFLSQDDVDFWKQSVAEYFDGARVDLVAVIMKGEETQFSKTKKMLDKRVM